MNLIEQSKSYGTSPQREEGAQRGRRRGRWLRGEKKKGFKPGSAEFMAKLRKMRGKKVTWEEVENLLSKGLQFSCKSC